MHLYIIFSYDGFPVDIGGQWIGPQQPLIQDIAKSLGLGLVTQSWFGQAASHDESGAIRESIESNNINLCSGASTGLSPEVLFLEVSITAIFIKMLIVQEERILAAEIESMEELSRRVFGCSNWASGIFAQDLDSVTTQEYLDTNVSVVR